MAVFALFENNDRRNMLCPPQSPDVSTVKNIWSWMKRTHEIEEVKQHSEVVTLLILQRSDQRFCLCPGEQPPL